MNKRILGTLALALLGLASADRTLAQKSVLVDYKKAFDAFWNVPSADDPSVTRSGDMVQNIDCANNALAQARAALRGAWAVSAYKALGVEILKGYIKGATAFGGWGAADEFLKAVDFIKKFSDYAELALNSDTLEEFEEKVVEKIGKEQAEKLQKKYGKDVFKRIWDYFLPAKPTGTFEDDTTSASCKVHITLQVTKPAAGQKGHLYFSALGTNCRCLTALAAQAQPRSWRVIGNAELKAVRNGDKFDLVISNVTYEVGGECGCVTEGPGPGQQPTPPTPPPTEVTPPPPATPTPRFPGDNDDLVKKDQKVAEQTCKQKEVDYLNWQADANDAARRCLAGDKKACEDFKRWAKKRDDARKTFCECAKKAYGGAKLPLPPEVEKICNPPNETISTPTHTPTRTPTPPRPVSSDPCDGPRQTYEKARQDYLDSNGDPKLLTPAVKAKKNYCDCLKRVYKGKLPPEFQKFCDNTGLMVAPPTGTAPPPPTTETATPTVTPVPPAAPPSLTSGPRTYTPTYAPPPPTQTVRAPAPTSAPPPTPFVTTGPTSPPTTDPGSACNFWNGTWNATFIVLSDPQGHDRFVQLRTATLQIRRSGLTLNLQANVPQLRSIAPGNFVLPSGGTGVDPRTCGFVATGVGDMAGRTGVAFRIYNIQTTISGSTLSPISLDVELGTDGKLPGGSIIYRAFLAH